MDKVRVRAALTATLAVSSMISFHASLGSVGGVGGVVESGGVVSVVVESGGVVDGVVVLVVVSKDAQFAGESQTGPPNKLTESWEFTDDGAAATDAGYAPLLRCSVAQTIKQSAATDNRTDAITPNRH